MGTKHYQICNHQNSIIMVSIWATRRLNGGPRIQNEAVLAACVPSLYLSRRHEKLLDDAQALLYCDPEFDRQIASSLS
jgi:hypothetical protein